MLSEFTFHISGIWSTRPWQDSQPMPFLRWIEWLK